MIMNAYLITKSKIYQGKIHIDRKYIKFIENANINKAIYERLFATASEVRTQT